MKKLVIKNGTIIDVETGKSYIGMIEVENSKIKRIITNEEPLSEEIEILDVEGKYIIPGLIDMHCHINDRFAPHFVASGVTTVRNAAGNVLFLQNLIEQPSDAPTPRVYASDRMIDGSPGLWGPTSFGNLVTDDPEEARQEVRRQAKVGAKFIKLYGMIKREVMEAAVDEAKKFGLEVACDLIASREITALDAAKIGVTWFEHASGFAQELYPGWSPYENKEDWTHIDWENHDPEKVRELCEKMLQYNVKICPTMVCMDQAMKFPNYWNPNNQVIESVTKFEYLMEEWTNNTQYVEAIQTRTAIINNLTKMVAKTYYDLGGTVVAGTDTPALLYTYPGMALHRELEIFVEIGFSELEALQAATVNAAKSINLEDIGTIKEGKIADLVILHNNPLEDIKNTKDISLIVKGGKVYTQEELLNSGPSEEESNKRFQEFIQKWEVENMK